MREFLIIMATSLVTSLIFSLLAFDAVKEGAEYWYFIWQKSAIENKINIDLKKCMWIKSPWNTLDSVIWIPELKDCE